MSSITDTKAATLNIEKIRNDFPILAQQVNGHPLIYFDNAATNQKPLLVINALDQYYTSFNSNIHRGVHYLAEKATNAFEETRYALSEFINSKEKEEIIFTYGTTDSINLVANAWGRKYISEGDEIIISAMEHHSNIVPWQMLCEEKGAQLKVIPINPKGELLIEEYEKLLSEKTKLVSIVYISNALGTINPVGAITEKAKKVGARVLIDAAQASSHAKIDVQKLDCDFLALSAHKMFGPTGVGVLYGKREVLEAMPPYRGGGEMIKEVRFEKTTYNDIPYKFEAGTPNIADIVAFKHAIDYINHIGIETIAAYEHELLSYATNELSLLDRATIIGQAPNKASVLSFVIDGVHHFDIGMMLDARGIAIRTGHHCTQPLMHVLGLEGTARASFSIYNTKEEISFFVEALKRIIDRWK